MPRIPYGKEEATERMRQAIERYLRNVVRWLPPEEQEKIRRALEEGRPLRIPSPPRE